MGVPAFFRWLTKKYPSITKDCERGKDAGQQFDNLYLDMNGIIHPCTHPEDKPAPETEYDMFIAIQEYIEMIMKMTKPKKLLYMAVDGTAPRAKMNQQRSRRFRASQESKEKADSISAIKNKLRDIGCDVDNLPTRPHFDSNVITPGTQFMVNLSISLRAWIDEKLSADNEDPDGIWPKDLVVILSDASVPGEGEHKIMEYIRKQKAAPTYDPNIKHLLLGADADLIMLGLATHELEFTILREEFVYNQPRPCEICNAYGHDMSECRGDMRDEEDTSTKPVAPGFIFITLPALREYLEKEADGIDLERFIDDFVFLCFFVGNDFLPHLPSLEIREGAIDRLVNIYKDIMQEQGDQRVFLTESGQVNLHQCQLVLQHLGYQEDSIFKDRKSSDERYKQRCKRMKREKDEQKAQERGWAAASTIGGGGSGNPKAAYTAASLKADATNYRLQSMMVPASGDQKDPTESSPKGKKRPAEDEEDSEPEDNVVLGEIGWKERYYYRKFDSTSHSTIAHQVAREYVLGLCWVLAYYYQGCQDWQWFYPYHYAPFASDFKDIHKVPIKFDRKAVPFTPLEQLMSVFPAASSKNLPITWRELMTNPKSAIIDFYPIDFCLDLNGKKAAWMGVALLPFIDEGRLKASLKNVYPDLTRDEVERNSHGDHLIFVSKGKIDSKNLLEDAMDTLTSTGKEFEIIPSQLNDIAGVIKHHPVFTPKATNTYCFEYHDPEYDESFIFQAKILEGAKAPEKVLTDMDIVGQFRGTINLPPSKHGMSKAGSRMLNHSIESAYGHNQRNSSGGYNNRGGSGYVPFGGGRGAAGGHGGGGNPYANRGGYVPPPLPQGRPSYPPASSYRR